MNMFRGIRYIIYSLLDPIGLGVTQRGRDPQTGPDPLVGPLVTSSRPYGPKASQKGHQLEVGAQQSPRLFLILLQYLFRKSMSYTTINDALILRDVQVDQPRRQLGRYMHLLASASVYAKLNQIMHIYRLTQVLQLVPSKQDFSDFIRALFWAGSHSSSHPTKCRSTPNVNTLW